MDQLPTVLDGLGTVGVVLLVGWLVMTGRLVPRSTVDLLQATVQKRDEQVDKLIASVDTANKMIEAVVTVAGKRTPHDEGDPK